MICRLTLAPGATAPPGQPTRVVAESTTTVHAAGLLTMVGAPGPLDGKIVNVSSWLGTVEACDSLVPPMVMVRSSGGAPSAEIVAARRGPMLTNPLPVA